MGGVMDYTIYIALSLPILFIKLRNVKRAAHDTVFIQCLDRTILTVFQMYGPYQAIIKKTIG